MTVIRATGLGPKLAVTSFGMAFIDTKHGPLALLHAPLQPVNVLPAVGVAVSVTTVPMAYRAEQVAPQAINGVASPLVTEPVPLPALLTITSPAAIALPLSTVEKLMCRPRLVLKFASTSKLAELLKVPPTLDGAGVKLTDTWQVWPGNSVCPVQPSLLFWNGAATGILMLMLLATPAVAVKVMTCAGDVVPARAANVSWLGTALTVPNRTSPMTLGWLTDAALLEKTRNCEFWVEVVFPMGGLRRKSSMQVAPGGNAAGQLLTMFHCEGVAIAPPKPVTAMLPVLVMVIVCGALGTPVKVVKLSVPVGETLNAGEPVLKLAVTILAVSIVTTHGPLALVQASLQPVNVLPTVGVAVSVTTVPGK